MSKSFVHSRLGAILAMRAEMMTFEEIAGATDFKGKPDALAQAFYKVADEMGIERKRPLKSDKYDDEATVKSWQALNLSYSQINAMTGLSFSAVQKLCAKYGVTIASMKGKTNRKVSREEIHRLSDEGLNNNEIALKLGCSKTVVGDVLGGRRCEYPIEEMPLSMRVPADVRNIALGKWRMY